MSAFRMAPQHSDSEKTCKHQIIFWARVPLTVRAMCEWCSDLTVKRAGGGTSGEVFSQTLWHRCPRLETNPALADHTHKIYAIERLIKIQYVTILCVCVGGLSGPSTVYCGEARCLLRPAKNRQSEWYLRRDRCPTSLLPLVAVVDEPLCS